MTPAGEVKIADHPLNALAVAGMNDDRNDGKLRRQPFDDYHAVTRVGSSRGTLKVVVERDKRCRRKISSGFANHGVSVAPHVHLLAWRKQTPYGSKTLDTFVVIFEDEEHGEGRGKRRLVHVKNTRRADKVSIMREFQLIFTG